MAKNINMFLKFETNLKKKTKKEDYNNFYLKCGILLWADALEKFRNNVLKTYGLCVRHCLSAPALSWGCNA